MSTADPVTKKLLQENADWRLIVTSCFQLSEECADGVFCGNMALNRAQQWDRSLVRLRTLGILERVAKGTSNNGTASYRVCNPEGVKQALIEVGIDPDAKLPGDFFELHNRKKAG
jgi:hypothetical protein